MLPAVQLLNSSWVIKNVPGDLKADAVLCVIAGSFLLIPLEIVFIHIYTGFQ